MSNLRDRLPRITAVLLLLFFSGFVLSSYIAGPVNRVLVERETALRELTRSGALTSCTYLNDSNAEIRSLIVSCLTLNQENLLVAIDPKGKVLSRLRLDPTTDALQRDRIAQKTPRLIEVTWHFTGEGLVYRVKSAEGESLLDPVSLEELTKVRIRYE